MTAPFEKTPVWLDWYKNPSKPRFAPPPGAVDARRPLARAQLDPVLGEELVRPQPDGVRVRLAGEVGLRQGRALVGQVGLVPEQDDAALEPLLAQRGGGLETALPGTDDDDGPGPAHACTSIGRSLA